jgi:NAD(P)-dependent dehydrogenase (short-subunit alcohol dehydrogenase family)
MSIERPTALVTGTSSGLGRGVAERLSASGWRVLGTVRRPLPLLPFDTAVCDVTDDDDVDALGSDVMKRWGRLDALINNAGAALAGPVEELTPAELRWQLEVNLVAPLAIVRACLPALRAASGVVVQVSSVSGVVSDAMFGAYNASKRGLEGASEALAQEVAGQGVRVVVVEPGAFNTGIAGRGLLAESRGATGLYSAGWEGLDAWRDWHGTQSADPTGCIDAIVAAATRPDAPLRLPVGAGVADELRRHARELIEQADAAEAFLAST